MKARIGCLSILALWALLGMMIYLTGGYENSDGAGPFAVVGLIGVVLFVVASVTDALVVRVKRRRQSRAAKRQ